MISTILFGVNLATAALAAESFVLQTRDLIPVQPPSLDVVTDNYAVFTRSNIVSRSSQYLRLLRREFSPTDKPIGTATLPEFAGKELIVTLTLDGADAPMIIDTGSSDVWVPTAGFSCVTNDGKPQAVSVAKCAGLSCEY